MESINYNNSHIFKKINDISNKINKLKEDILSKEICACYIKEDSLVLIDKMYVMYHLLVQERDIVNAKKVYTQYMEFIVREKSQKIFDDLSISSEDHENVLEIEKTFEEDKKEIEERYIEKLEKIEKNIDTLYNIQKGIDRAPLFNEDKDSSMRNKHYHFNKKDNDGN